MIDKSKTYRSRNGLEVTIYRTDAEGEYPVHGAVCEGDCLEPTTWTADGKHIKHKNSEFDLVEVKPRIKREMWLVALADGSVQVSLREENIGLWTSAIAVEHHVMDVEEGHGL